MTKIDDEIEQAKKHRTKCLKLIPEESWEMRKFDSWKDSYPRFIANLFGQLESEITYNRDKDEIFEAVIRIPKEDLYTFAQNPVEYLQKKVNSVPFTITSEQNVIDFAQKLILKAIKGE